MGWSSGTAGSPGIRLTFTNWPRPSAGKLATRSAAGEATEMSFERIENTQAAFRIHHANRGWGFGILIGEKARADEEEPALKMKRMSRVMARRVIFWQWTMSAPIYGLPVELS